MNRNVILAIRLLLTAWLLWTVWNNAHWSVWLSLTLIYVWSEIHWFTSREAARITAKIIGPEKVRHEIESR